MVASPGKLMFFRGNMIKHWWFKMVSSTTGGTDKLWFTDVHGMNMYRVCQFFHVCCPYEREELSQGAGFAVKCSPHTSFKLGTRVNWENMVEM